MYKSVGIIGGMGPAATCDLMQKIISNTVSPNDQGHIHLYVDCNTSIPDRTAAILSGGEDPLPEMIKSARKLESIGADLLIMPCNTAYYFYEELAASVGIPVLHMPRETALLLRREGVGTAGVLATTGTIRTGVYGKALSEQGISVLYPDEEQQEFLMEVIYGYVKKGITDPEQLPVGRLAALAEDLMVRGAERIILGCTELPIAFRSVKGIPLADPTEILAEAAIRAAGATAVRDAEALQPPI